MGRPKSKKIIDDSKSINNEEKSLELEVPMDVEEMTLEQGQVLTQEETLDLNESDVEIVVVESQQTIADKAQVFLSELSTPALTIGELNQKFNQDYFTNARDNGCDYTAYGKWQQAYCAMLTGAFKLRNKTVLDVGCAFGAVTYGFKMCGVYAIGVDVASYLIKKVYRGIRFVNAMAQDMSAIESNSIDFIHASYLLNDIPKSELAKTFKEFKRVLKAGGKILTISNLGNDTVVDGSNLHSKGSIVQSASDAGLQVKNFDAELVHCDQSEYKFIETYKWDVLCFE